MIRFEKGEAYWARPAIEGLAPRLVCCMGHDGREVRFADIGDAFVGRVEHFAFGGGEPHEMCQVLADDGEYHVSASVPVAFADAARMIETMRRRRRVLP